MFLETSFPQEMWEKARIHSVVLRGDRVGCHLRFWRHLMGDDIGALKVYKRTSYCDESGMHLKAEWVDPVGDVWQKADIDGFDQDDKSHFQVRQTVLF